MAEKADQKAQGKRLRQARERAGYDTASAAAAAMGFSADTYIQHENGTRGYKARALVYAEAFNVAPEWLLWGRHESKMDEIRRALEAIEDERRRELAEDLILATIRQVAKSAA